MFQDICALLKKSPGRKNCQVLDIIYILTYYCSDTKFGPHPGIVRQMKFVDVFGRYTGSDPLGWAWVPFRTHRKENELHLCVN